MHVCVVYGYGFNASGSAIYNMNFVEALHREGHTVTMTCHETREELLEHAPGFEVQRTGWGWALTKPGMRIESRVDVAFPVSYARPELEGAVILSQMCAASRQQYACAMRERLERIHRDNPIDVLIVHHLSLLAMIVADFACDHGIPHHVIVHGTGLEFAIKPDELLREMVARSLSRVSSIVALNSDVERRVVEQFSGLSRRIEIAPPGVDFSRFEPASTGHDRPCRDTIGYVGRLTMDKGVHALMVAFVNIVKRRPQARLELYGGGPDGAGLRAMQEAMLVGDVPGMRRILEATSTQGRGVEQAAQLMAPLEPCWSWLEDRPDCVRRAARAIEFRGYVSHEALARCYNEFDALVLPSIVAEAFPLVLLEALASGVPAMASNAHGQGWFLDVVERAIPDMAGRLRFTSSPTSYVASMTEVCVDMLTHRPGDGFADTAREFLEARYAWGPITRSILGEDLPIVYKETRGA